jgi:hypothetical protein
MPIRASADFDLTLLVMVNRFAATNAIDRKLRIDR